MITKKSTIFFVFSSGIIGWLFCLKYSVISIEDRIRLAKKNLVIAKRDQHILKSEWKSLTSPERIQRLALKHLKMHQMELRDLKEFDLSIFRPEDSNNKKSVGLSQLINRIMNNNNSESDL